MSVAELDIGAGPRLTGRAAKPVEAAFVRDLSEADFALLASERGTAPPTIQRLRDRHHLLARCLAQGMKDFEAAAVTGYDLSRISILKKDPTFRELLDGYGKVKEAAFADYQERAAVVANMALDQLADHMESDDVSPSFALRVATALGDRTGNAPVQKSVSVSATVNLGERLRLARQRLPAPVEAEFTEVSK